MSLPDRESAQTPTFFRSSKIEIRDVVSRGNTAPQPPQGNANELAASDIGSILQHVSGTSVQEIEKLIGELQILRDMLQREAARVEREVVGYAALLQNARGSITAISESLSVWQTDRGDASRISA